MSREEFERLDRDMCLGMCYGIYDKFDDDGLICLGMCVSGDDIIIGKTASFFEDDIVVLFKRFLKKDCFMGMKYVEIGIID